MAHYGDGSASLSRRMTAIAMIHKSKTNTIQVLSVTTLQVHMSIFFRHLD